MDNIDISPNSQPTLSGGPFLARVVSHQDSTYMGVLEVEILRVSGNTESEGQLRLVRYMSPFWGTTDSRHVAKDPNDHNNTQKSYGMWMIPPDTGSIVVVFFINGNPKMGYWMGCVPDEGMNFMTPGLAATAQVVEGGPRAPTSEYNKEVNNVPYDSAQIKKPKHPFADVLKAQGLLLDDTRGITTSSARRETPSMVFGISTPGPFDRQTAAKQGPIGKLEHQIPNAYVSHLGGTTFVMDDGDDKFLRKTHAKDGPPLYASIEQGETDGKSTIPHNELVRIRTRTGHQILLHNSEDLIYIGNARGTAWIELTSNGKIDIYAADSISMHTKSNFNITAGGSINLTAGASINLNAGGAFMATAKSNYEIKAGADGLLTCAGTSNINAGGNHVETAAQIHMNGPGAVVAGDAPKAARIPQAEPWAGHENLHNTALKYSTTTDTFLKQKGANV